MLFERKSIGASSRGSLQTSLHQEEGAVRTCSSLRCFLLASSVWLLASVGLVSSSALGQLTLPVRHRGRLGTSLSSRFYSGGQDTPQLQRLSLFLDLLVPSGPALPPVPTYISRCWRFYFPSQGSTSLVSCVIQLAPGTQQT